MFEFHYLFYGEEKFLQVDIEEEKEKFERHYIKILHEQV